METGNHRNRAEVEKIIIIKKINKINILTKMHTK